MIENINYKSICIFYIGVMLLFVSCSFAQETTSEKRLTPGEIDSISPIAPVAGTSGVTGIKTRVLKGDPNGSGLYTIELTVPANTKIQSHNHPDDRVATVVSGTWYIGYGDKFDEKKLKELPPGSFYTEPPGIMHFARTGKDPVVVMITGRGPTGTRYFDTKDDKPKKVE